jgi:hypothetical protein
MKNYKKWNKMFLVGMAAMALAFGMITLGCATAPTQPHSFVPDESSDVATIRFRSVSYGGTTSGSNVSFFSYGDVVETKKEKWNPVSFPAGTPLQFTLKAHYNSIAPPANAGGILGIVVQSIYLARMIDKKVLFDCQPLEAGKSYDLWFVKSDGKVGKGINTLVLTEAMQEDFIGGSGDALIMALKIRDKLTVVAEQEFKK